MSFLCEVISTLTVEPSLTVGLLPRITPGDQYFATRGSTSSDRGREVSFLCEVVSTLTVEPSLTVGLLPRIPARRATVRPALLRSNSILRHPRINFFGPRRNATLQVNQAASKACALQRLNRLRASDAAFAMHHGLN